MKKDFECWACKHRFEADDNLDVVCPKCGSDNVDYTTWHFPKWLWKVGSLLFFLWIVIHLGIWVWKLIPERGTPASYESKIEQNIASDDSIAEELGFDIPPILRIVTQPTPNDDGIYSFEATVDHAPACKYYFTLMDKLKKEEVARSSDGKFSEVPGTKFEGGSYDLLLRAERGDSVLATLDLPGFIVIEKVDKKMTPAELQKLVNARDESLVGIGENKYLAPVCELHFEGLSKKAINIPTDMAAVLLKLENKSWKSVTITKLDYDNTKHINSITMKVVEAPKLSDEEWE